MFVCKCCGEEKARWCGEGGNGLEPHMCDHIHCDGCGMHYSLENEEAASIETIGDLMALMEKMYNGK
jgi:hypothetical protein